MQSDDNTLNILIADDHPLFRGALRQVLSGLPNACEIHEAGDFAGAKRLVEEGEDYDLILLDLNMPGSSGHSAIVGLSAVQSNIPIIVVSASESPETIRRAIELGASGYIAKSASMETIREAIERVLEGQVWVPPHIELGVETDPEISELIERLGTLTPQQTRVLTMIGEGLLNKQIAYELGVSEATIKAHVSAVLTKLNVDSRTQAVILLSKLSANSPALSLRG
ncbi:response regulator [Notoacmeibacter ruber]|uniref:DNA-binding response regulator n=1 Tax=Notoacmeibacter ruber TaxID=2670375 RepID=A0A3L7JCA6_9HYPH|nr:response regulator transcription factor [Notoacmeibacter ruber]RLQ87191.1 DNA-binding response regulator [Notoacmeibacter ruber]